MNCPDPVLPDFSELTSEQLQALAGKPLCCVKCGGELELRCAAGHVHRAPRTARPTAPKPPTICPRCHLEVPRSGRPGRLRKYHEHCLTRSEKYSRAYVAAVRARNVDQAGEAAR